MIDSNSGFEMESVYPYEGVGKACRADKSKEMVFVASWIPISKDED